jgi:hypothetical protein
MYLVYNSDMQNSEGPIRLPFELSNLVECSAATLFNK